MNSILRQIQSKIPDCTYHVDTGLGRLKQSLEQYDVNLNPDYQRDHVWTEGQAMTFMGSLLENSNAIPPFWFNWVNDPFKQAKSELLDGKQRINACLKWLDNDIPAKFITGETIWYKDLNEIDLRNVNLSVTLSWNFVDLDRKGVLEFYLRLNSGGTIHTQEELDKVKQLIKEL